MESLRRAFVLGLGVSGRGAASLLLDEGVEVIAQEEGVLSEDVSDLVHRGLVIEGECLPVGCDAVVVSPGISPQHPTILEAKRRGIAVYGEAELALRRARGRTVLGVTGTNGKTTVTLLITYLLRQAGLSAVALGNVGRPFSEIVGLPDETIVVGEFSSYQLETLSTPVVSAAVILNITADHLDRYDNFAAYAAAKLRLGRCVCKGGELWVSETAHSSWVDEVPRSIFGVHGADLWVAERAVWLRGKRLCPLPDAYQGRFDFEVMNYLAAVALCYRFVDDPSHLCRVEGFEKPPHRLQHVGTVNGFHFVDDGKATNIASVLEAVKALKAPVVLLAGGRHKGESYKAWRAAFADKVSSVHCFGEAAQLIAQDLDGTCAITKHSDLEGAFHQAVASASAESTILLSPGCSSFDAYRDFTERSAHFQRLVRQVVPKTAILD